MTLLLVALFLLVAVIDSVTSDEPRTPSELRDLIDTIEDAFDEDFGDSGERDSKVFCDKCMMTVKKVGSDPGKYYLEAL